MCSAANKAIRKTKNKEKAITEMGYPASILIFNDGKLIRAKNPSEAEKLYERLK